MRRPGRSTWAPFPFPVIEGFYTLANRARSICPFIDLACRSGFWAHRAGLPIFGLWVTSGLSGLTVHHPCVRLSVCRPFQSHHLMALSLGTIIFCDLGRSLMASFDGVSHCALDTPFPVTSSARFPSRREATAFGCRRLKRPRWGALHLWPSRFGSCPGRDLRLRSIRA